MSGHADAVPKPLSENVRRAKALREAFLADGVYCAHFLGPAGAGKTSLIEQTLSIFSLDARVAVLAADYQAGSDSTPLERYGFPVRSVSTAGVGRLDARMVERTLQDSNLQSLEYLLIEDACNLVCPSTSDLGAHDKIVVCSITDGDDIALMYPAAFSQADLVALNKVDLLPHLSFDVARAKENIAKVNPDVEILSVSCKTGQGLANWCRWLEDRRSSYLASNRLLP